MSFQLSGFRFQRIRGGFCIFRKAACPPEPRRRRESRQLTAGEAGFTLVEMIVAVALFAVVMLVAVGALLALTGANRKAQALQSVMNNLNIALDGMARNIRTGTNYQCGGVAAQGYSDCQLDGKPIFAFRPYCDKSLQSSCPAPWEYAYDGGGNMCGNGKQVICRSEDGGKTWVQLTAPEVSIQSMTFYVVGSQPGDSTQPKVLIVISGQAGASSEKTRTTFHVQVVAVQRQLDL